MADTVQSASRVSALDQALASHSSADSFKIGFHKGTRGKGHFREVLRLESSNASTAVGSTVKHKFQISRAGIFAGACVNLRLTGAVGGASAADKISWGSEQGYAACAAIASIALKTHSRTLMELDAVQCGQLISRSPHSAAFAEMCGASWAENAVWGTSHGTNLENDARGILAEHHNQATYKPVYDLHLPCLFSCLAQQQNKDSYASCLDTSFCEQLILEVVVNPLSAYCKLFPPASGNSATLPTACECTLTTINCVPFDREGTIALNYKAKSSTQLMQTRYSKIGESATLEGTSATAISRQTTEIKLNSSDLCRSLTLVPVLENKYNYRIPRVISATLRASGRVIAHQEWNDSKYANLTSATTSALAQPGLTQGAGFTLADTPSFSSAQQSLTLNFCDLPFTTTEASGQVSLAGMSSMSLSCVVETRHTDKYTVQVHSEAISVLSIAADSGAIISSNSI